MAKLTSFGQFTRKLRVDHNEYLKDMAERLSVTSTYLSAVEHGRRNAPVEWSERITDVYQLTTSQTEALCKAVSDSRTYDKLDIAHLSFADKHLIEEVVKQLPILDDGKRNILQGLVTDKP